MSLYVPPGQQNVVAQRITPPGIRSSITAFVGASPNAGSSTAANTAAHVSSLGGQAETKAGLILEAANFAALAAAAAATVDLTIKVRQDAYLEYMGILVTGAAGAIEADISMDVEYMGDLMFMNTRCLALCHDLSDAAGGGKQPKNLGFFKAGHEISLRLTNNNAAVAATGSIFFYFRPTR